MPLPRLGQTVSSAEKPQLTVSCVSLACCGVCSWFNAMRRIAAAMGLPFVQRDFDSLTEDETAALKQKVRYYTAATRSL